MSLISHHVILFSKREADDKVMTEDLEKGRKEGRKEGRKKERKEGRRVGR